MKVRVTQKHIRRPRSSEIGRYSIRLALIEAGWAENPHVSKFFAIAYGHSVSLPQSVRQFIVRTDRGLPVKPFEFDIAELPEISEQEREWWRHGRVREAK